LIDRGRTIVTELAPKAPFAPIAITGGVLADEAIQLLRSETADHGAQAVWLTCGFGAHASRSRIRSFSNGLVFAILPWCGKTRQPPRDERDMA
jgi:hypothetical protein